MSDNDGVNSANEEENNEENENEEENENNEEKEGEENENEEENENNEEKEGEENENEEEIDDENKEKEEIDKKNKGKNLFLTQKLEPRLESKIDIIGLKSNDTTINNLKNNFNDIFQYNNLKTKKKKTALSIISEINKDLEFLKSDLLRKNIISDKQKKYNFDVYKKEDEKSSISDMKYDNFVNDNEKPQTKNKKLQVALENFNFGDTKLKENIEIIRSNSRKNSQRGKSKNEKTQIDEQPLKKEDIRNNNASNQNKNYVSEQFQQTLNKQYQEEPPRKNNDYQFKNDNYIPNNYNNIHRTKNKISQQNHYRTVEDLYKSPNREPVYFDKSQQNNVNRINNYNHLNQVLNQRNPFYSGTNNIEVLKENLIPNRYTEREPRFEKPNDQLNINNAMNILLEKENY